MIRRQLVTGVVVTFVLIVLLGVLYPLAVTAIAQTTMSNSANGSIVHRSGTAVGSSLIGQSFTDSDGKPIGRYFQSRPSAAGAGYDAQASSGSNLGPANPDLLSAVRERAAAYRTLNGLAANAPVPSDAVTASGSGLDPAISVANARLQSQRVARERGLSVAVVRQLVERHTDDRALGFLGEPTVNVLELNLALDALDRT